MREPLIPDQNKLSKDRDWSTPPALSDVDPVEQLIATAFLQIRQGTQARSGNGSLEIENKTGPRMANSTISGTDLIQRVSAAYKSAIFHLALFWNGRFRALQDGDPLLGEQRRHREKLPQMQARFLDFIEKRLFRQPRMRSFAKS